MFAVQLSETVPSPGAAASCCGVAGATASVAKPLTQVGALKTTPLTPPATEFAA